MRNAEDLQFFLRQSDSPKHQAVSFQSFYRIDSHAAHHFLDLMPPCSHQIDKALTSLIWIQTLHQFRALGSNAPVAFTTLAGSAQVASHAISAAVAI